MAWRETDQHVAAKKKAADMYRVEAITPEHTRQYAVKMYELRYRGWGDETRALEEVARWCGMTPRSLKRLIKGETKEPGLSVFNRVRSAYLGYCDRLITKLQNEVHADLERYGPDASLASIADELEALETKVQQAKAR
jgi:hypothetical protein